MTENGSKSLKSGQKTIKNGKKHSKTASGPIRKEIEQKVAKIAKIRPTEHRDTDPFISFCGLGDLGEISFLCLFFSTPIPIPIPTPIWKRDLKLET